MFVRSLLTTCLALAFVAPLAAQEEAPAPEPIRNAVGHMVFFTLAEDTPENRQKLVEACRKYLTGHEGVLHFSAGVIAEEFNRDVNDQGFDVALHMVFRDKAAHDTYQDHPRHLEFIETSKSLWSSVRVFDSYVDVPRRGRGQRVRNVNGEGEGRVRRPEQAADSDGSR